VTRQQKRRNDQEVILLNLLVQQFREIATTSCSRCRNDILQNSWDQPNGPR